MAAQFQTVSRQGIMTTGHLGLALSGKGTGRPEAYGDAGSRKPEEASFFQLFANVASDSEERVREYIYITAVNILPMADLEAKFIFVDDAEATKTPMFATVIIACAIFFFNQCAKENCGENIQACLERKCNKR